MAAPCNDTVATSTAASGGDEAAALASELKELRKQLSRKDDVLRVRNNQLIEISKLLDERESLWKASLSRTPLPAMTCRDSWATRYPFNLCSYFKFIMCLTSPRNYVSGNSSCTGEACKLLTVRFVTECHSAPANKLLSNSIVVPERKHVWLWLYRSIWPGRGWGSRGALTVSSHGCCGRLRVSSSACPPEEGLVPRRQPSSSRRLPRCARPCVDERAPTTRAYRTHGFLLCHSSERACDFGFYPLSSSGSLANANYLFSS